MSKIYIFNSSGFMGRNLCEALRATQWSKHVIEVPPTGCEAIDPKSLIIHLDSSAEERTAASAVTDLAKLQRVFQLAEASSSTLWVESTYTVSGGNGAHACYGKWAEILASHYRSKVRTCFLRLYCVYGPGQGDNLIHRALTAGFERGMVGVNGPNFIRDWIHVDDVVSYMLHLFELHISRKSLPPVLHVGTGRGLPVSHALDLIKKVTRLNFDCYTGPTPTHEPVVSVAQKLVTGWTPRIPFEEGVFNTYLHYERKRGDTETGSQGSGQRLAEEATAQ